VKGLIEFGGIAVIGIFALVLFERASAAKVAARSNAYQQNTYTGLIGVTGANIINSIWNNAGANPSPSDPSWNTVNNDFAAFDAVSF
jgi:hypothetical protein